MHGGYGSEGIFNVARGAGVNEAGNYIINNGPTYMQSLIIVIRRAVIQIKSGLVCHLVRAKYPNKRSVK